jgi:8-oxo-dGTP pyrophosphatase MutT (NUDIX family)
MLQQLIRSLEIRLTQPLPGALAHEPMRATPVGSIKPDFSHKLPPKPGAVIIVLFEESGKIKFPLIKRQEYLGAHSGQISLPGGKAERNEDEVETALREAWEEIGLDRNEITVIGKLSNFFVIPSNFLVTPIVVAATGIPHFKADKREVARILMCDLFEITDPHAVRSKEILAAGQFKMMAPHFEIDGEIVWGATAMILNELCFVIREIM